MNKEEKEAIEHLTKKMEYHKDKPLDTYVWLTLDEHYVRVILNLIQKQDKIIDKMAEQLAGLVIWKDEEDVILGDKEEVKEYFKKEVEKE